MAATTRQPRPAELPQGDDIHNASSTPDWRRMTEVAHDHIAHRAYELYEERGREPGHDVDDWIKAEYEIEQRKSCE
jgi:Protein of unknown function (DUF2934)